jgi:hypothetical protein
MTGHSPVDRGKPRSKIHVLSDRRGLPPSVAISAGNTNDHTDLHTWIRDRGIGGRITRKGIDTSDKLGRHRWVIEQAMA